MSRPVSIDVIKAGLIAAIDSLVPELFPNVRREGHEFVLGDIHGAPGSSLSIRRTGAKAGWWKDFGGTARGDILDLVAAGACEGDVKAAIPWAIAYLNLGHLSDADARAAEARARRAAASAKTAQASDLDTLRRAAKGHYLSAAQIPVTPADRYLLGRGIDIRRMKRPPSALRYKLMRCPETSTPDRPVMRPCMIACVVSPLTGDFLTIHRTFLDVRPSGDVVKAAMKNPKRAYCDYGGGYIPLARGASTKRLADAPAGERLFLSEGIEDGLSVALSLPDARVGAALSLSNVGGIALPDRLGGVVIAGQNDTAPDAIRALAAAEARLVARGVTVATVKPPADFKDWNVWLQSLVATTLGEARRMA